MIKNITFGTDPEFFLYNRRLDKTLSSIPIIGNSDKYNPTSLNDGFFIVSDNVLVEGNVPISKTPMEFISTMIELKKRIMAFMASKIDIYLYGIELLSDDVRELENCFLCHPDALQFGCSPYMNVWDGEKHKAGDLSSESYRTAGFHVHIGYEKDCGNQYTGKMINNVIAKAFDLFVTLPSYNTHFDKRRFENYGGLGQYRDTKYGIECRSLGGFFTDDKYLEWVINQTDKMINYIKDENNFNKILSLERPATKVVNDEFTFDSSIYEDIDLSYSEQLFRKTVEKNVVID